MVSAYLTAGGVFLLKALDGSGRWVWASNAANNEKYFCPSCHAELSTRKGTLKRSHFAHRKNECGGFSEGETPEHLQGKTTLAKFFEKAGYISEMESYLPKLKQRPDIVIQKDFQKSIIEFQCAPLATSKMKARSVGYRRANLKFLWILGQKYLLKKKMTQQVAKFLKWNRVRGYYLIYYLANRQRFRVIYNIQQTDYLPLRYKIIEFCNVIALKNFFNKKDIFEFCKISKNERITQFNAFKLDILRSKGEFRSLQIRCYLQRQELEKLKNLLFASRYSPPIYATKELYWKSDLIFMKKFNNFSDNILSQKMILEHKNYLFEVPLLDINRLIDLQVKGMNRFVDSQEI